MKHFLFLTMILSSCSVQPDEIKSKQAVEKLLVEYYGALKDKDFIKMRQITTDNFILFENGKYFNNDSVINYFKSAPKFSVTYLYESFNTKVDSKSARMIYSKTANFVIGDSIHLAVKNLETATFIRENNKWKLEHLHTTKEE